MDIDKVCIFTCLLLSGAKHSINVCSLAPNRMVHAVFVLPGYLQDSQRRIEQKLEKHTLQPDDELPEEEDAVNEPEELADEAPAPELKKDN